MKAWSLDSQQQKSLLHSIPFSSRSFEKKVQEPTLYKGRWTTWIGYPYFQRINGLESSLVLGKNSFNQPIN